MSKMYYTLEEAAAKLGISEEELKSLAASGDLTPLRDRDKLMFKRDQVDERAGGGESAGPIPLADDSMAGGTAAGASAAGASAAGDPSMETDTFELADTGLGLGGSSLSGSATGTGVNVFETGEIDMADPMAKTQVESGGLDDDDDLELEPVGSGSGLLDLTRESDDTSLGMQLDDVDFKPGSTEDAAEESDMGSAIGTGVFEGALSMETVEATVPGESQAGMESAVGPALPAEPSVKLASVGTSSSDAASEGMMGGLMVGALVSIVIALLITASAVAGMSGGLGGIIGQSNMILWITCGALVVLSIVAGVVGYVTAKASG